MPPIYLGACQTPVLSDRSDLTPWLERIAGFTPPGIWLFPELFFGGFDYARPDHWCLESSGALGAMQRFSIDSGHILAGSFWEKDAGEFYNTLFLCLPDAQTPRPVYRKMHLFTLSQEEKLFSPGTHPPEPMTLETIRMGWAVCFDLRFPELFRYQSARGARLFLIPSQWPEVRKNHWTSLLTARAIENQAWILGANACGPSSLGHLAGRSTLISPWGDVHFEAGEEPAIKSMRLSRTELAGQSFPFDSRTSDRFQIVASKCNVTPS